MSPEEAAAAYVAEPTVANRNRAVEANLGLVGHVIKRGHWAARDKDDLFQVGCEGLFVALRYYRPERGGWHNIAFLGVDSAIRNYRGRLADVVRRKRTDRRFDPAHPTFSLDAEEAAPTLQALTVEQPNTVEVQWLLSHLTKQQVRLVSLVCEGYSHAEIAQKMKCAKRTVLVRWARALEAMRAAAGVPMAAKPTRRFASVCEVHPERKAHAKNKCRACYKRDYNQRTRLQ